MTESHEIYRVSGDSTSGLVNQVNNILNLLSNRLDKIEGLRGDPAFYSSNFEYPASSISGVLQASSTSEADFSSLAIGDLGLTTTLIDDGYVKIINGSITTSYLGDGFLEIRDANDTIIHSFGESP